jgi:hypothetical protein
MLIEFAMLQILTGCDVTAAAMGACGPCGSAEVPGSYTICETKTVVTPGSSSTPTPKPMRLCEYYTNGTIDVPTLTTITAWVEVGSRYCIGDTIPEPVSYPPLETQLKDSFTAYLSAPVAWRAGTGKPEPFEHVQFFVESSAVTVQGSLSGSPAKIRFRPVAHRWSFSDGDNLSGESVAKSFAAEGPGWGRASVRYEVDYQVSSWVLAASSWELSSNRVDLIVFDPPRKTLLVP